MVVIDSTGTQLIQKEYDVGDDLATSVYAVSQTDNKGYIITGWASHSNYNVDAFVLKTTPDGEREWLKYYGSPGLHEIGYSIMENNPNEYEIGGIKGNRAYIFAIDSLGNQKWEWVSPDSSDMEVRGLQKQPNGDWTYISYTYRPTTYSWDPDLDPVFDVSVPVFICRDSAMHLLERKELGPFAYRDAAFTMIPSRDGGWITAGISTQLTDAGWVDTIQTLYGRVVKLDHEGEIEWSVKDTAFYSKYYDQSYLSGVAESPTGSIYAVGYCDHTQDGVLRSYGWLVKITADGCIDTLCTTTSLYDQMFGKAAKIRVYPNPAADYVTFEVDNTSHDIRAELFDLNGRNVAGYNLHAGKNVISLEGGKYAAGMYLWRALSEEGRLLDSGKLVITGN